MEEIGKLIELLNEYEQEEGCWGLKYGKLHNKYYDDYDQKDEEIRLISKWYGFIKWLVENDKIDIKALVVKGEMRSGWDFDNKKGDEETGEESWNKYYSELCLMLLAIQENPIDFLCSILK